MRRMEHHEQDDEKFSPEVHVRAVRMVLYTGRAWLSLAGDRVDLGEDRRRG